MVRLQPEGWLEGGLKGRLDRHSERGERTARGKKARACLEDRKGPVGLGGDVLHPGEEGVTLGGRSVENLDGQAYGLGLYPLGSGEPQKVIEQRSDIYSNWMAELVPGWEDIGRGACGENEKGKGLGFQGQPRRTPGSLGLGYVMLQAENPVRGWCRHVVLKEVSGHQWADLPLNPSSAVGSRTTPLSLDRQFSPL